SDFVPMRLRLDQRRGVKDGQTVRFVVPVLDLGVGYLTLAAGANEQRALPAAGDWTPALAGEEPSLEAALDAAAEPLPEIPGGRPAAALGAVSDDFGGAPDVPVEDPPPDEEQAPTASDERQTKARTDAQAKKLNTLVGPMRVAGEITTEHLYGAVA